MKLSDIFLEPPIKPNYAGLYEWYEHGGAKWYSTVPPRRKLRPIVAGLIDISACGMFAIMGTAAFMAWWTR